MDPYLEDPELWPGVHSRLIAALDKELSRRLPARYFVEVGERVYALDTKAEFVGVPDVAVLERRHVREESSAYSAPRDGGVLVLEAELPVPETAHETYLEIREGDHVVTSVEVLSPANKRSGAGREEYEKKRRRTLGTRTHLVEIDLLRAGEPPPARLREPVPPRRGDYRILVSRADRRPLADVYPFGVQEPIPPFPMPLRRPDHDLEIDLKPLLDEIYDRGQYRERVNYRRAATPHLPDDDAAWADALLRDAGVR